jgi:hypothetical protein
VKPEAILFNITGDSILRTCVVVPDVLPARVNQHVAIIRAAPGIPARFLHLFLVQPRTKHFLSGLSAGGTREAVTKAQLESLKVIHPPQDVLDQFAFPRPDPGPRFSPAPTVRTIPAYGESHRNRPKISPKGQRPDPWPFPPSVNVRDRLIAQHTGIDAAPFPSHNRLNLNG